MQKFTQKVSIDFNENPKSIEHIKENKNSHLCIKVSNIGHTHTKTKHRIQQNDKLYLIKFF